MDGRNEPHPNSPRAQAQRPKPGVFAVSTVQVSTPPVRIIGGGKRRHRSGYQLSDR